MENRVHVSEIKQLIKDDFITYDQAAEIFGISISGVYQRFWRMERGLLKGKRTEYLKQSEVQRLVNCLRASQQSIYKQIIELDKEQTGSEVIP